MVLKVVTKSCRSVWPSLVLVRATWFLLMSPEEIMAVMQWLVLSCGNGSLGKCHPCHARLSRVREKSDIALCGCRNLHADLLATEAEYSTLGSALQEKP